MASLIGWLKKTKDIADQFPQQPLPRGSTGGVIGYVPPALGATRGQIGIPTYPTASRPGFNLGNFRGSGILEDMVNSPAKIYGGGIKMTHGQYKQGIGDIVTGALESPLGFLPVGRIAQAGKLHLLKLGAKQGLGYGSAYGAGSAMSQNAPLPDILKSAAVSGAVGAGGGALLAGGFKVVPPLARGVVNLDKAISTKYPATQKLNVSAVGMSTKNVGEKLGKTDDYVEAFKNRKILNESEKIAGQPHEVYKFDNRYTVQNKTTGENVSFATERAAINKFIRLKASDEPLASPKPTPVGKNVGGEKVFGKDGKAWLDYNKRYSGVDMHTAKSKAEFDAVSRGDPKVFSKTPDAKRLQDLIDGTKKVGGADNQSYDALFAQKAREAGLYTRDMNGSTIAGRDKAAVDRYASTPNLSKQEEFNLIGYKPERFTPPKPTVAAKPTPPLTTVSANTKRMQLNAAEQAQLKKATTQDIPTLTNKRVQEIADTVGLDTTKLSQKQSAKLIAQQLNTRRESVRLMKEHTQLRTSGAPQKELEARIATAYDMTGTSVAQGTHAARTLQARRMLADGLKTPEQRVFGLLNLAGVETKAVAKRFAKVDFNNPKEVFSAYRDLVPSHAEDWLDKFRYTNMLSSPLTHIINTSANIGSSTIMAPLRKGVEGMLDATRAGITGGPRTRFAGEAGAYYKGVAHAFGDAKKAFSDVMTGKAALTQPDIVSGVKDPMTSSFNIPLATKGVAGTADKLLTIIPRAMDASDKFFMALVRGGEKSALSLRQGKGVKVGNVDKIAEEAAQYNMWRRPLGIKEQGKVLQAIDWLPKTVGEARNSKNPIIRTGAKFTMPFIVTPTNLFKQGIEFSPLGATTFWGSANKTAQAAKMFIGTGIIATASGLLAAKGDLTFAEPSNQKERDAFRAEGKQAYAIKIGDKWFGYTKLHPAISFNLATMAGVKDALDKGTIDQDGADKFMQIFGGMLGFMRDQSYMRAVGDMTNVLQSRDGSSIGDAIAAQASNTINQLLPAKSMTSWIGRMIDPTQRRVDYSANPFEQIYQQVIKDIPGANKAVAPRIDPYTGLPVKSDNRIINAISPSRVTNDRGYGNTTGLNIDQRQMMKDLMAGDERTTFRNEIMLQKGKARVAQQEKDRFQKDTQGAQAPTSGGKMENGIKPLADGKFYAKVGNDYKTFPSKKDAQLAIDKNTFKESGKDSAMIGDTYHYKDENGDPKSKPKYKYEFDVADSQNQLDMTVAKDDDNIQGWGNAAVKQLKALKTLRDKYNKDSQPDKVDDTQKKIEVLKHQMEKYAGYGGFTKGRAGSKPTASFKTASLADVPKPKGITVRKLATPNFKTTNRKISVNKIPSSYLNRKLG